MELNALGELADAPGGLALGLVVAVFLAGFRHGFDIDHIAAITDIASASPDRRTSLLLATFYALGHMVVVFGLGVAAVFIGGSIPAYLDSIAGRLIGLSLVALGLSVIYSIVRYRHDFRMKSRWMLLVAGARRGLSWMMPTSEVVVEHAHEHPVDGHHDHDHDHGHGHGHDPVLPAPNDPPLPAVAVRTRTHAHTHRHIVPMPPDPFTEYSRKTSFVLGMVHGVGAETPTQILLFTTAAGLAGAVGGVSLVALFVTGLFLGNSVLAIASTAGLSAGRTLPALYVGMAATAAAVSIYVGGLYLFDRVDLLPGLLGR